LRRYYLLTDNHYAHLVPAVAAGAHSWLPCKLADAVHWHPFPVIFAIVQQLLCLFQDTSRALYFFCVSYNQQRWLNDCAKYPSYSCSQHMTCVPWNSLHPALWSPD